MNVELGKKYHREIWTLIRSGFHSSVMAFLSLAPVAAGYRFSFLFLKFVLLINKEPPRQNNCDITPLNIVWAFTC